MIIEIDDSHAPRLISKEQFVKELYPVIFVNADRNKLNELFRLHGLPPGGYSLPRACYAGRSVRDGNLYAIWLGRLVLREDASKPCIYILQIAEEWL